jgi:uncharacterized OB-fold protein
MAHTGTFADTDKRRGPVTVADGEVRLVGARCDSCTTHAFPLQANCPRCGRSMSAIHLPAIGTVWSWTVQRVRPKPPFEGPDEFEPFAVGYVDVGPVRVEARLEGKPVGEWRIGDTVRLVAGAADANGDVWSYRFEATDDATPGGAT